MCRSIKTLRQSDVPATDDEIRAAALQYVRKISGFRHPTRRHEAAFQEAVDEGRPCAVAQRATWPERRPGIATPPPGRGRRPCRGVRCVSSRRSRSTRER
jgi:hypothetical protein